MTRAEWEVQQAEEQRRTGLHGFDPGMPWGVAYWHERLGIVFFHAVMWGIVFPAMFVGILYVFGLMVEGIGQRNAEHDRCLKNATNGYEIRQCR